MSLKAFTAPQQFASALAKLTPLDVSRARLALSPGEFLSKVNAREPADLASPHDWLEIALVSFTDTVLAQIQPDGSHKLMLVDRAAWLLIVHGVRLPPAAGPVPIKPQPAGQGDAVYVYDASSGEALEHFSGGPAAICPLAAGGVPDRCGAG